MKKIALLFLCRDKINHVKLWQKFIEDGGDKISVYIHADNYTNVKDDFIKKYIIEENIKITWGDLYPGIKLLYKYAIKNPDNFKFILLSDSTIPILRFDNIYKKLIENDKSIIQYSKQNIYQMMGQRFRNEQAKNKEFRKYIKWEHYYFNECWTILNRRHVDMILNDSIYYQIFKNTFAYDENYPMYILSVNNELNNIENKIITYVNWKQGYYEGGNKHPKKYFSIKRWDSIGIIRSGSLFARKFAIQCNIGKISPYRM